MSFIELIGSVQRYSGLSRQESTDALEMIVESIAVRLDEKDRKNFAAQLPGLLSDIALSVLPTQENSQGDLVDQFICYEHIDEHRARQQIKAAWQALQESISKRQIREIKAQVPVLSSILAA